MIDLATAIEIVSKFMSKPGQSHWKSVKRALRYIKGSLNVGLKFDTSNQTFVEVIGFAELTGQVILLKGNQPRDMYSRFAVVQSAGAANVKK